MNGNKGLISIATILLAALVLFGACPNTLAQAKTTFTPEDNYAIPGYNAVINFAVNGTYAKATLENDTWAFSDLQLNNSQALENLRISAQSSNLTISSFRITNTTYWSARLRYTVEGQGKETINLGLVPKQYEWTVVSNGVYLEKGDRWAITPDATLTIKGATNNVTITCYDFVDSLRSGGNGTNISFYQQHSVVVIATVAAAILIILGITVKWKNKENLD